MIRAVLDTNILVSTLIKKEGKPYQIITQARTKYEWLTSEFILKETRRVVARKHIQTRYPNRVTPSRTNNFLKYVKVAAEAVNVKTKVLAVVQDLNDDPIVACAVDGRAHYLVTGDPHLLMLKSFRGIQIVTPAQFLEILKKE